MQTATATMVPLREARESTGLTQQELAETAGLSRGTLWNWEAGRCVPRNFDDFKAVAKLVGVPARRLVLGA